MQHLSDENGHAYQLRRAGWEGVTPEQSAAGGFPMERLASVADLLERAGEWSLYGSIMQDRDRAVRMVEELCSSRDSASPPKSRL